MSSLSSAGSLNSAPGRPLGAIAGAGTIQVAADSPGGLLAALEAALPGAAGGRADTARPPTG
ncbi:MAG TPA: hypothetical protein VKX24_04125, partial [Acidimicrobiia bacterium]|nr:hypothetical protein [Acidimicrobiia bacterium]